MKIPPVILTEEHYQQIKNALDAVAAIQPHIDQAVRAGVPMDEHQKQLTETAESLRRLRNVYFPGR